MKTYRLKLKPLGPWATPWQADSLFSALCWQLVAADGEAPLNELLSQFRKGNPPFILSDALPDGWFPCPLSAAVKQLSELKAKRPAWVREAQFQALIKDPGYLLPQIEPDKPVLESSRLRASIDRLSGTTSPGGRLFEIAHWSLSNKDSGGLLSLFLRAGSFLGRTVNLLERLSLSGFGKKRSSGLGAFTVAGEPAPCPWMDEMEGANAFVSLSHFVPASDDPTEGRWRLLTKYPKFSPGVPGGHVFKGRLTMFRPGSVFRVKGELRPFYGRVLSNLFPDFPEAIHYAFAFPVPMRWPEE